MIWLILSGEVTHPVQIPEKFLLLAIWHIKNLDGFSGGPTFIGCASLIYTLPNHQNINASWKK